MVRIRSGADVCDDTIPGDRCPEADFRGQQMSHIWHSGYFSASNLGGSFSVTSVKLLASDVAFTSYN